MEERIETMRFAIGNGLNYVDTAPLYGAGFSEEVVGRAIKDLRPHCFLATKVHLAANSDGRSIRRSIRESMSRLRTDYIDLVQVHWPNPFADQVEIWRTLAAAVADGEVRYLGVSNYCAREIEEARRILGTVPLVTNQYELNLLNRGVLRDRDLYRGDVELIAYSPLNQGRLIANAPQAAVVSEIAAQYGVSPAQVVLAAVLADGNCRAVVKASTISHVRELLGALTFSLSREELHRIVECSPERPFLIPPDEITLLGTPAVPAYRSSEEALENRFDLIPSPAEMAERLRRGALAMPLRLQRRPEGGFVSDAYDPLDHVKKFWGSVLASPGQPIPAYVVET